MSIDTVRILLFADDIALLSEFTNKVQQLVSCLHTWYIKWKIYINANKSKIVHFRKIRTNKTDELFKKRE